MADLIPCAGGCGEVRKKWGKTGMCRSCASRARMTRLNADPEFVAAGRERKREQMKRRHADPEFVAAHRERMRRLHRSGARLSDRVCKINGCGNRLARHNRSGVCSECFTGGRVTRGVVQ